MTAPLSEGHSILWDELLPYEQQQGGYWLYPQGCDVYGNGKVWVSVPKPEQPGELTSYRNQVRHLAQRIGTRARELDNKEMAALAQALERTAATQVTCANPAE